MPLVQIMANGRPTGIIVDQDELKAAHDAWWARNMKCQMCSFAYPQHAAHCEHVGMLRCTACKRWTAAPAGICADCQPEPPPPAAAPAVEPCEASIDAAYYRQMAACCLSPWLYDRYTRLAEQAEAQADVSPEGWIICQCGHTYAEHDASDTEHPCQQCGCRLFVEEGVDAARQLAARGLAPMAGGAVDVLIPTATVQRVTGWYSQRVDLPRPNGYVHTIYEHTYRLACGHSVPTFDGYPQAAELCCPDCTRAAHDTLRCQRCGCWRNTAGDIRIYSTGRIVCGRCI